MVPYLYQLFAVVQKMHYIIISTNLASKFKRIVTGTAPSNGVISDECSEQYQHQRI